MTTLPDDARALFDGPNLAHLATLLPGWRAAQRAALGCPGGRPHRVPHLTRLAEGRNIDRDARVAISVAAHDRPFTMATVRGRVVERVDGDAGWEIIDRIAYKYTGAPYSERTDRAAFLVEPEHVTAWAFG